MIVVHDPDGRVTAVTFDPVPEGHSAALTKMGRTFIEIEPLADVTTIDLVLKHYVVEGDIAPRPPLALIVQQLRRKVTIGGVPVGATVSVVVEGIEVTLDAPEVEFDEPGLVTFKVAPSWPWLEAELDVEVE